MAIQDGHRWGKWVYKKDTLEIVYHSEEKWEYGVDLERCRNSSDILDWIIQIAQKSWATPEDIGNLVRALDELAEYDLQSLCYGSQEIDFKKRLLG